MRHRRTGTVIGVIAALVALTPVGADARPSKPTQVSVQEKTCTETLYERGAYRSVIDPLVPDRFELQPFNPPVPPNAPPYAGPDRVRLFVTEYTCDSAVTTSGARQRSQRNVATIIVSAALTSISGQPADGSYVLAWATDNTLQNDRLNDIGWTSDLLDRSSGLTDVMVSPGPPPGDLTQVTQRFAGAGWDHSLVSASFISFTPQPDGTTAFYRDTAQGSFAVCYANSGGSTTTGVVTGDLRSTPLALLTIAPPVYAGFGGPNPYAPTTSLARGDWTATLTDGACPAPASGTS